MKSVLFVFRVTGSGYVEYTTFLGMELHLPCFLPLGQYIENVICRIGATALAVSLRTLG